jgi:EAL and modified HD-GYP domain-containing signal transduction protein
MHANTAAPVVPKVIAPGLIARQPILDVNRNVVAYELFDRSTAPNAYDVESDIFLSFSAMNHIGENMLPGPMLIFINRTHQSLMGGHLDLVRADKVVLKIGPVPGHLKEDIESLQHTLHELKSRGFRLAFNHTVLAPVYATWQPLADYVKLDLTVITPEKLRAFVTAAKSRTKAQLIAEKVETADQFAALRAQGVTLFQGYWVANPEVIKTKVVSPEHAHVLQLLNLVRNQASTDAIEAALKKDAVLGFNLMRLINSCGFGLTREVTSFRDAVMLMGLNRLMRWAALLLITSKANGSPSVVGTTAVVRGRLMELLAPKTATTEERDSAFLVGLFSLLDKMLGIPLAQALSLLSLPQAVVDAVLHGTGVFGEMLMLTVACENDDDTKFAEAASTLGLGNHQINMAHMEALIWADNLVNVA